MPSTTMTVRLEEREKEAFSLLARAKGMTLSEYARRCMADDFEDEMDARLADEAYLEHLADPATYSCDEIDAMLR